MKRLKHLLKGDNAVPVATLALAAVVVSVVGWRNDQAKGRAGDPPKTQWALLSQGPLCAQINGNRRRYWHPALGMPCNVKDAPQWPDGDFAFVVDYLLPGEEISNERVFKLVPESDQPKPGF